MSTAVIVFAKAPVAGLAKTRLAPALGADGAAALAARMLRHALVQAVRADVGPVGLCGTPDAAHPALQDAAASFGVALTAQEAGDLGLRMQRAFSRVLTDHGRALGIGTDAPALDATMLREAAGRLLDHDVVFVPAHDGGYALVGQRRADPRWFSDVAWSTTASAPRRAGSRCQSCTSAPVAQSTRSLPWSSAEGRWAWRWKDRIDRRFLAQFQGLSPRPEGPAAPLRKAATTTTRSTGETA